jgi:hypothetical protein
VPKEWATSPLAGTEHDLFALGVIIRQLYSSRRTIEQNAIADLSDAPKQVRIIVDRLMSEDPYSRPSATVVADALSSIAGAGNEAV